MVAVLPLKFRILIKYKVNTAEDSFFIRLLQHNCTSHSIITEAFAKLISNDTECDFWPSCDDLYKSLNFSNKKLFAFLLLWAQDRRCLGLVCGVERDLKSKVFKNSKPRPTFVGVLHLVCRTVPLLLRFFTYLSGLILKISIFKLRLASFMKITSYCIIKIPAKVRKTPSFLVKKSCHAHRVLSQK